MNRELQRPDRLSEYMENSAILEPFFEWLAGEPSFEITLTDRLRIGRLLRAEGDWTLDRLEDGLGALLTRDPEQSARFRHSFRQFFAADSQPEFRPRPLDRRALIAGLQRLKDNVPTPEGTGKMVAQLGPVGVTVRVSSVSGTVAPSPLFWLLECEWPESVRRAAARGGLDGHHYPWESRGQGYERFISPNRANYDANRKGGTAPVERYQPNGYGLYDMAGNVWQWTWDRWGGYSETTEALVDPRGADHGMSRVYRGGGWGHSARRLRCAYRDGWHASGAYGGLGFRLAGGQTDEGFAKLDEGGERGSRDEPPSEPPEESMADVWGGVFGKVWGKVFHGKNESRRVGRK